MNESATISSGNTRVIRLLSLAGILGGLVLSCGDQMFFYGPFANLSDISTMDTGQVPIATMGTGASWRLEFTAICALLAAWLYTLGAGALYYALLPAGKKIAITVCILFGMAMISVGVIHTVYFAIGVGAQNAYSFGSGLEDAATATRLAVEVFNTETIMLYVPGIIVTVLFFYAVLFKKTHLPKWYVLLFPMVLINSQYIVLPLLPDNRFKVSLMGGYVNGSLTIFFLFMAVALWNVGEKPECKGGN